MSKYCCVYGCSNCSRNNRNVSYHEFPFQNKERLQQWINAINKENFIPSRLSVICSEHFVNSDYLVHNNRLKLNAVPTIFNFNEPQNVLCSNENVLVSDEHLKSEDCVNQNSQFTNTSPLCILQRDKSRKIQKLLLKRKRTIKRLRKRINRFTEALCMATKSNLNYRQQN